LKTPCLSADEDLVVCLAAQDGDGDDNDGGRNKGDPVDPTPSDSFSDKAADNWRSRGSDHSSNHPEGHGLASFTDRKEVGDDSASNSLGSRTAEATHEAEEDEGVERWGEGTSYKPSAEEGIRAGDDDVSAIDLGQGRKEEGTNSIT
jgi:hypothetical protein